MSLKLKKKLQKAVLNVAKVARKDSQYFELAICSTRRIFYHQSSFSKG